MPKGKGYGRNRMKKKNKRSMKRGNKSNMIGQGGVVMRTGMAEGTLRS